MGEEQQELDAPEGTAAPAAPQDEDKQKRGRRAVWIALLFIVVLAMGTGAGFALFVAKSMQPMPAADKPERIAFTAGTSTQELAHRLQQAGLVRNADIFYYYLRWVKEGPRFQAGTYEWKPGVTFRQLINDLDQGNTVKDEVDKVTIPEGYTVAQIAERLGELHLVDPAVWLKVADTSRDWNSPWAAMIPDDPALRHRLEGYLFPETYEFAKDATAQDIIQRMLAELDHKLAELPSGWQDQMKARGLSFHQLLTVASLIEREATLDEERPIVASVIYNRLQKGMPLQIDAAIQYLFDQPKDHLYDKDLRIESPYNTYLHTGLPPGPIASPGLASIKAALNPATTNYYYYVARNDGSKGHYFAETLEQHDANIAKSKKNGGGS